jgi:hypothetical protein
VLDRLGYRLGGVVKLTGGRLAVDQKCATPEAE